MSVQEDPIEEPIVDDYDNTIEIENTSQDDMLRNDVDQFWNIRSYFNRGTLLEMPHYSFHIIGIAYTGHFVFNHYDTLLYYSYLLSLFMGTAYIGNVLFIIIQNYIDKTRLSQIKEVPEVDEYQLFLEKDMDTMIHIYKDPLMKAQEYENTNFSFLKELKEVQHHYESVLPFNHNTQLTMYYNHGDESFHYFTKNSNIQYKVLNSVCRSYLLHIRCLNLFKDETDLDRICPCNDDDFEKIEESSDSESEDEKEEYKTTRNSVFYVKKTRKQKENKKQETKDKIIHKFIYKGNMEEYNKIHNPTETVSIEKVDYAAYKQAQESNLWGVLFFHIGQKSDGLFQIKTTL